MWRALGRRGLGAGHAWVRGSGRALHASDHHGGSNNLLKKFASKTKKKFWYEGSSLGPHYMHKPSKLDQLVKTATPKMGKEESIRKRALDGLLYRALADLVSNWEIDSDLHDLNVELTKVSLSPDFSVCRVYWKTTLSVEKNDHLEAVLQKSAPRMRHLLITQQILQNVPPIVFVRDRENAARAEVERLLQAADFGPPEDQDDEDRRHLGEAEAKPGPAEAQTSLFGIDHAALLKQIAEYKRQKARPRAGEDGGGGGGKQHQAKAQRWRKGRKGKKGRHPQEEEDDDVTPQAYHRLGPPGDGVQPHDPGSVEDELQMALRELETEDGGDAAGRACPGRNRLLRRSQDSRPSNNNDDDM
ncbi:putative ribosome-binding factor A, mitochondrial [Tachyglossus aculeatus]|uniref:putative ribosome-binding factor A, mitochondrial n=1 Tax=Tachyglossus aculeatus TaxID=9261 RepID=UPI0018F5201B|nr:putative ribosome-binding factor A, mitochondrial [Tachyglossus aculeatus]